MIKHIVLIKPKDDNTNQKIEIILNDIITLTQKITEIKNIITAKDINNRCDGYKYFFEMTFENHEGLQIWTDHILHIPIKHTLRSISTLLIFDYII